MTRSHPVPLAPQESDVTDVEVDLADLRGLERTQHELLDLDVALYSRVTVDLRADLQRLARAVHAVGQGGHGVFELGRPDRGLRRRRQHCSAQQHGDRRAAPENLGKTHRSIIGLMA